MKIKQLISDKIFFWKINWDFYWMERRNKHMRKKYCRIGCHHIRNHTYSYSGTDYKRTVTIRAIKCDYCNYMFFANKHDKEKYMEQERKSTERFSAFCESLSSANRKIKSVGKDKQRELSDSSSCIHIFSMGSKKCERCGYVTHTMDMCKGKK